MMSLAEIMRHYFRLDYHSAIQDYLAAAEQHQLHVWRYLELNRVLFTQSGASSGAMKGNCRMYLQAVGISSA